VERGALLLEIDPRPFRLALAQEEAGLARDLAQAAYAHAELRRYEDLFARMLVSREDYEQRRTNASALDATVEADRAAVETARVNLGYTRITAPIAGRTGALLVQGGNIIKANDDKLLTLRQMSPIDVAFAVPAQRLAEIQRFQSKGDLVVSVTSADGSALQVGKLRFIDNSVDPSTGTILLKARFDNEARALWPGQFLTVRLALTLLEEAVVVPARAVQTGQQGEYVFVVATNLVAESRAVQTGPRDNDLVVVTAGVRAGEQVVTEGQLGLVSGASVQPKALEQTSPGERGP
jgi:membrane fusion protein, multidrug efflux system